MSDTPRTIFVVPMNHFDPIWRRCWDRRFEWNGNTYASYADIEQAVIDDWLTVAERSDATFVLEQTVSLRKYLERRPERLETLRRLAQAGRFEVLASGEVIPDSNMPIGESGVRNLLLGILWAERTLGVPVTTGCRCDGFGSSAQGPQVFRQCEIAWLPFLSYRVPDGDYWRGLDGTTLYVRPPAARLLLGSNVKLAPCPSCHGSGCDACLGRGFVQNGRVEMTTWLEELGDEPCGVMQLGGEETLPCMDLPEQMAQRNAETPGLAYRFGTYKDIAAAFKADIDRVDAPPPERISRDPDAALSSSGCWVTRIRLKQRNRRAEHTLLAAETLAALAWAGGETYPTEPLTDAWRTLVFTHFHDALPATHVDPAYDELMAMYDDVDRTAADVATRSASALSRSSAPSTPATKAGAARSCAVFNTLSWPRTAPVEIVVDTWSSPWAAARDDDGDLPVYDVRHGADGRTTVQVLARNVPAFGGRSLRLEPCDAVPAVEQVAGDMIETDAFRVASNAVGVTSIVDKRTGRELIDYAHYYAGELILEGDYGDPWATRSPNRRRERLNCFGRRTAVRRIPGGAEIVFSGTHPGNFHDFEVNWLAWTQRVILRDGLPYVEFDTEVDWDTHNRRLRIAFPTTTHTDDGDYEIPYGTLRRRRYDVCTYHPNGVNGDWPVTHWAAPASKTGSVAVINRGECSYRVEGGNVLVSLLRSPTTPWCMYEPNFYRMPLFDGMRDSGVHRFGLALYPFDALWSAADVTQQAWSYNAPLVARADATPAGEPRLRLEATGTMISTLKRAEEGDALIVRLYEYAGRGEAVLLDVPPGFSRAAQVNLLERRAESLPVRSGRVRVQVGAFKLVTIRLER